MKGTVGICAVVLVLTVGYITMTHRAQSGRVLLEVVSELNSVKGKISQLIRNNQKKNEKVEKTLAGDLKNIERKMEKLKDRMPLERDIPEKKTDDSMSILGSMKDKTGPNSILDSSLLSNAIVDKLIESYLKGSLSVDKITKSIAEKPELLSLIPSLLGTEEEKQIPSHHVRPAEIPTTLMKNIIEEQQDEEIGNKYMQYGGLKSFMNLKSFSGQKNMKNRTEGAGAPYNQRLRAVYHQNQMSKEESGQASLYHPIRTPGVSGPVVNRVRSYLKEPVERSMKGLERMGYYVRDRTGLERRASSEKSVKEEKEEKEEVKEKEDDKPVLKEHQNIFIRGKSPLKKEGILEKAVKLLEKPVSNGLVKETKTEKALESEEEKDQLKEEEEPTENKPSSKSLKEKPEAQTENGKKE